QTWGGAYHWLNFFIGKGLLTSEGEVWRRQRRRIQPLFKAGRMGTYVAGVVSLADELGGRLEARADSGTAVDIVPEIVRFTLNVVTSTLLGMPLQEDIVPLRESLLTCIAWVSRQTRAYPLYGLLHRGDRLPSTRRNRRFLQALAVVESVVERTIQLHREERGDPESLITALLETRETGDPVPIRDEVVTMLLAGTETTAMALCWSLSLLSQHPDVRTRLERESDEVLGRGLPDHSDLARLTFTRMVGLEALRLYPPVYTLSFKAVETKVLAGVTVPAGSRVVLGLYGLHRNSRHWTAPHQFDPDRFDAERSAGRHRFAYLPFSAGPRHCVGQHFALMEMQVVLAVLLGRLRLELAPGQPEGMALGFTLRPRRGLKMILHRR
ncbi:MAG: cytochrome P450, partial [Acidobacteriota bacterium]